MPAAVDARWARLETLRKLILIFLLCCASAVAQGVKIAGAWIPVHMKWEHAPPSINPRLENAPATVLYFDERGGFAVVGCTLNREPGRYTIVSAGDGQIVLYGEWDRRLPGLVNFRLISRTVDVQGETLPGPWQTEKLSLTPKGYLRFKGRLYRRMKELDSSVREVLPKSPNDSRQQPQKLPCRRG